LRNRYTNQEETVIVRIYTHTDNSRTNRAILAETLLGSRHSRASYAAQFGRLEALDNRNPNANRFVISQSLATTATELSPEVFA